ncbi:M20/M25/M40 family metallo-hydrolase [Gillisia hiemivivida]|uniref:M20/M25/M40 family metallo-hydrolase n=2 Tax=Gillisia hiemivivida TaxID=291190 RepID=A0A5C6ZPT1_9FLAO|nr:M20/M25/M40 family metallo-hydrolase [Gillisia hiemivivida]
MRDFFIFITMIKTYLSTAGLGLLLLFSACNLTQKSTEESKVIIPAKIETPKASIDQASVKSEIEFLASNDLQGRNTGSEGINKAAVYIQDILQKNNIKPYFTTYRDSFEVKDAIGYNIVGFKEGTDPVLKNEFLIISAHYDHIGLLSPIGKDSIANGANDNAAGSVAVLELAKYFGAAPISKRSILFVFLSAEEKGLLGSKHLAKRLKDENLDLYVNLNIEMIGVPMVGKDHMAYLTGFEESNLAAKFNEYSNEKVLGFLPKAKEFNLFKRSDNYSFYKEFNVPAQTISTFDFTNYNYYHQVQDEADKMDIPFMADLIESIIPGIYTMANTSTKEIKLN